MKMTIKQVADSLANRHENPINIKFTPEIVSALMWYAEGKAVSAYASRVSEHLKGQRLRAEACRYRKMALEILGKTQYQDIIYAPEFGQHVEIGAWDFDIDADTEGGTHD
ncbi:hypothetical protein [Trichloromonas sp.]|uniref:hypothetical protein n=1 Tax=Trichloromonas sp. TaxID=3069249 RepID=UPI002A4086D7|nr:hypothetical protein [Trichloromonas sp.]